MQITETEYQEIKQRLVHVKEEIRVISKRYPPQLHEQDLAWHQGRECELEWIVDLLNSIKERKHKNGNSNPED